MTPAKAWALMPKSVRVGYRVYRFVPITTLETMEKGISGQARVIRGEMGIVNELPAAKMVNTAMHEIMHCIWFLNGLSDGADEEDAVDMMANGMCALMLDNPKLFAWMKKILESQ